MKLRSGITLTLLLLQIAAVNVLPQVNAPTLKEEVPLPSWKQEVPLDHNQRLTLWSEHGWLKAARFDDKNGLIWAVVLKKWDPKEKIRVKREGTGISVYGANKQLMLRNSYYDSFFPMVLRCYHASADVDTGAFIDPGRFGLHHFFAVACSDIRCLCNSDSGEWIYAGVGSFNRFDCIARLMPRGLYGGSGRNSGGTEGLYQRMDDYEIYDEDGFLFTQQMSDFLANRKMGILDKKAPPLSISQWRNTSPIVLDSLRGSVVLLYFWGTWCKPCVAHLKDISSLADRFKAYPLRVVTVHTVAGSDQLEKVLASSGFSLPVGVDSGPTTKVYAENMIPKYVLIDKRGIVRAITDEAPSDVLIKQYLAL